MVVLFIRIWKAKRTKIGLTRSFLKLGFPYGKERFFDCEVNQYYTIAHVETLFADEV